MNIDSQIKQLEAQLKHLKNIRHNQGVNGAAQDFIKRLKTNATNAELKFQKQLKQRK